MRKEIGLAVFGLAVIALTARAYEYPLQFTPNPGYRGLVVAGYQFQGGEVVGTCSYYTVSGHGGGKGGGGHQPVGKVYQQTCRWDKYGNLLSVNSSGEPTPPIPVSTNGTQVIYAIDAATGDYTGTDSKLPERGFVNTPGPHYSWLTPALSAVLQQTVYTNTIYLRSDGDLPVNITAVDPSAQHAKVVLDGTTCIGTIQPGTICSITISYDLTKAQSNNGAKTASDTLRIDLTSNAGAPQDFIQQFTILVP